MTLASEELEKEMEELVERKLPSLSSPVTNYIANLFSNPSFPEWEQIREHWIGITHLEIPERPEERVRVLNLKLKHSRHMGDGCLILSTFYREETSRTQPAIDLVMMLGRTGYNVAGLYAITVGEEKGVVVYPVLADKLPEIAVQLGPTLFRTYLKDRNPPLRVILHTPYGERFLRVRYSLS